MTTTVHRTLLRSTLKAKRINIDLYISGYSSVLLIFPVFFGF